MIRIVRFVLYIMVIFVIHGTLYAVDPPSNDDKSSNPIEIRWGFLENQGQWADDGLFRVNASGFYVKFQPDGVSFMSERESESYRIDSDEFEEEHEEGEEIHEDEYEYYVWKMKFGGGASKAQVEARDIVAARTNFFLGSDSSKWQRKVPEYRELTYRGVWEGIDVRFFLTEGGALKYEFVLAPGADPDQIRIEFEGLDGIEVMESGQMRLDHPWGPVTEDVPVAFAESDHRDVPVKFVKTGNTAYRFEVDDFPRDEAWVIDPLIMYWSSFANAFLPGSNYSYDVSYDQTGHLYMCGRTNQGFPATTGAYQTAHGGSVVDAYVAKFTPDGSNLAFMTYLGGSGLEQSDAIKIGPNGLVYICGHSVSPNFPITAGAISASSGVGYTPWVACLSSDGTNLIYSTCFGLNIRGYATGLTVVSGNELILSGWCLGSGTTFPTSPGAFLSTSTGTAMGWVCRLNATGTGLLWSTLLGGSGFDRLFDVGVNDLEEPYVVGSSNSPNYPVTPGAWHETPALRSILTRLNSTGSALIYSTWVAPVGDLYAIDVHPTSREAYVAGYFYPTTLPFSATVGAFQTVAAGSQDALVGRFNASGTAPVYLTFLGGGGVDRAIDISVKNNGEAFVTGYTSSVNLQTTTCQFQPNQNGSYDAFLAHFSPLGDTLGHGGISYIGGSSSDYFNPTVKVRESPAGDTLFCSLTTHSSDFPITPGAFETVKLNGNSDTPAAFKLIPFSLAISDTSACGQDSIEMHTLTLLDNILWSTGDTTSNTWINQSGQYWISGSINNCPFSDTFNVVLNNFPGSLGPDTLLCQAGPFSMNLNPGMGNTWLWSTSATTPSITVTSAGTYWVSITDSVSGCTDTDTIVIQQSLPPVVNLSSGPICQGDSLLLDADPGNNYPGATYLWSNSATTQQSLFPGGILVWVDLTNADGCTTRDSSFIVVNPLPIVTIGPDSTVCDTSVFTCDAGPGFTSYLWSNNATTQVANFTQSGLVWVEVNDANGCTNRDSLLLTMAQQSPPNLGPNQSICSGNSVIFNADPGGQYPGAAFLWHNNATIPQITVNTTGLVWVEVITAAGCILGDSVYLTVNPLPTVNIGPDTTLCDTNVFTSDAGPGFSGYLWSNNATTQTANFTQSGTIWTQITDANGCQNRDSMLLTMGAHPQPDLGPDTTLCEGSSLTLIPLGNGIGYGFDWSNNSTAAGITVNQSGTYSVIATQLSSGCVGEDSILITMVPGPIPVLPADTLVCDAGVFDLNPGSFDSYNWSEGSSLAVLSVSETGNYGVTVTDGNGCENSAEAQVRFNSTPNPDLGPDLELCVEERYNLSIPRVPGNLMQWSNGSAGNSMIVDESGTYWVEVSNECGRSSDTIQVVFLRENRGPFLPNAFHPGGEINENGIFKATGEQVEDFQLTVYDRWGALIYQTQMIQDGWDGTIDGKDAQEGVYVYIMQLRACDGQMVRRSGTVVLLR